jgi:hypothetical protein
MKIYIKQGTLWLAAIIAGFLSVAPCKADIQAVVTIDKMYCQRPTETGLNDRDEVYMIVNTHSPKGPSSKRLPRKDDYYEFFQNTHGEDRGWTNQDQVRQGKPILWKGNLAPGQSAHIFVVIGEQDNKDLAAIGRVLLKIAEIAAGGAGIVFGQPEAAAAVAGALEKISGAIEDSKDDVIGSFGLLLKNENGQLKKMWVAGKYTTEAGTNSGDFKCHGTSHSSYDVTAHVSQDHVAPDTPTPKRRIYLGTEIDRCGETSLRVQSVNGTVEVHKGETKEVQVPSKRFWWMCADSKEWTTAPDSTNLVIVTRGYGDRKITWKCYREE